MNIKTELITASIAVIVLSIALVVKTHMAEVPPVLKFVHDTVNIYHMPDAVMQEADTARYFLISYQTCLKADADSRITGHTWFETNGHFFSQKELNDDVYAGLPQKRDCYQGIVITGIFEFKSREDFNDFVVGFKGEAKPKKKTDCCCVGPYKVEWAPGALLSNPAVQSPLLFKDTL